MDISGGSESLFRGYGRSPVPGRMRPPFSFFLKKRMRRARWKRKSLFAAQPALRASWRKCGGLPNRCRPDLPAFCRVRSTLAVVDAAPPQLAEPRQSSWGGRPQGWSSLPRAFRFAMRCLPGIESTLPSPQQLPGCVSKKRSRGNPGAAPSTDLPQLPMCGSKRGAEGHPELPPASEPAIHG